MVRRSGSTTIVQETEVEIARATILVTLVLMALGISVAGERKERNPGA